MFDVPRWTFIFGIVGYILYFDALFFPRNIQLIILIILALATIPNLYFFRKHPPVAITSVPTQPRQSDEISIHEKTLIPFNGCFLESTPIKAELLCVILLVFSLTGTFFLGIFDLIGLIDYSLLDPSVYPFTVIITTIALIVFVITFIYQVFKSYILVKMVFFKSLLFLLFMGFFNLAISFIPDNSNYHLLRTGLNYLIASPGLVILPISILSFIFSVLNRIKMKKQKF